MPRFGALEEFDERDRRLWGEYSERLEQYFLANKIEDGATKRAVFLSSVGAAAYSTLRSLCVPQKPSEIPIATLLEKLKLHYDPKPSAIVARYRFNSCSQSAKESIQDYVARLRKLSSDCEYGTNLSEMIRDRLVCGVHNEAIQSKLLAETDLTLDKAIETAVAIETAEHNTRELHQPLNSKEDASAVQWLARPSDSNQSGGRRAAVKPRTQRWRRNSRCFRCLSVRHGGDECPFKDKQCFECNKVGHTRAAHKAGTIFEFEDVSPSVPESTQNDAGEEVYSLFSISTNKVCRSCPPLCLEVRLNGIPTVMEVDTGASASIISEQELRKLIKDFPLYRSGQRFRTYTGEEIPVKGVTEVLVETNHQSARLPLMVVPGRGTSLFGRNWLEKIKLDWPTLLGEASIKQMDVTTEFSDVFKDELGCYSGGKAHLLIDDSAKPQFYKARPVPLSLQKKVDDELRRMEDLGVIKPVSYSDWAAPLVIVPKPNGEVRICGDFKLTVNKVAALEQYPLPRIDELFSVLSGCKVFSKLDMSNAYNQIQLDENSQKYVVVNTPRGLRMYTRLAFGIHSAVAIFQKILSSLLSGIPQVAVYLDDVVIGGRDQGQHDELLEQVLRRMSQAGLRLNRRKCQLGLTQVTYLGHTISEQGIKPTDEKIRAIVEAPAPSDKRTLKSWLGMLSYFSKFLHNVATVLAPLYQLLKESQPWVWGREQERAFLKAKLMISKPPCLAHFNELLETTVSCDASPYGIGCVLSQTDLSGVERPVAFYSRSMNEAERRYAQTDREGLSVVSGVKKWHYYLYGRSFKLKTDHKPLLGLFGENKPLPVMASPRVQRWALLLSAYKYRLLYTPGNQHTHCDALSRLPLPDMPTEVPVPVEYIRLMEMIDSGPVSRRQIEAWMDRDPVLSLVCRFVVDGWPHDLSQYPSEVKVYHNRLGELSVQDRCLFWGSRMVIPPQGREMVLAELHEGHTGITRMKQRSRSYVWWPGIDSAIENRAAGCRTCQEHRPQTPPSELHPWAWPSQPWSRVHVDYCGPFLGQFWLLIMDAHSKWLDIHVTSSTSATTTIEKCRQSFASFGIPDTIVSDNATCFTCPEFQSFCTRNGVKHLTSPPWSPKSNGLVERAVQSFKHGMRKQKEGSLYTKLSRFLFHYRSTPHSVTNCSPAELMFGRPMKTHLDQLRRDARRGTVEFYQWAQKTRYDRSIQPREFKVGDSVYMYVMGKMQGTSKWLPGIVTECQGSSCTVRLLDGRNFRRHVDHIRLRPVIIPDIPQSSASSTADQTATQPGHGGTADTRTLSPVRNGASPLPPANEICVDGTIPARGMLTPPATQPGHGMLTPPAAVPHRQVPSSPRPSTGHGGSPRHVNAKPDSMNVPPTPHESEASAPPLRRSTRISIKPDRWGYS